MIYSSPEFILFCLAVLLAYRGFPRARFYVLLVSSFFFYAWAGTADTAIFLAVILLSWVSTWIAHRWPKWKSLSVTSGIVLMALHLLFWKYGSWVVSQIQILYPNFLGGRALHVPLPVGISFFTLQGIAYLVDYHRGEAEFISLPRYALFKSFFPQLVAGPIVRVKQLLPQLVALRAPTALEQASGAGLFCLGLFKKMVIADRCAAFADVVFANPTAYSRSVLFLAMLGYTAQIWADFSGYVDMGRGVAKAFGIWLPENFLSPYLARSPSEFWRRWHITLSQWIRDYIYIPLGGNRGGTARTTFVLLFTMGASGLWHGANWTFALWGLYHGVLLVLERWGRRVPKLNLLFAGAFGSAFAWLLMFSCTMVGWVIFRSQNISLAKAFLVGLLANGTSASAPAQASSALLGIVACFAFQIIYYLDLRTGQTPLWDRVRAKFMWAASVGEGFSARGLAAGLLLALIFVGTIFLRQESVSPAFIYFQF